MLDRFRVVIRTSQTSKMEHFAKIVNGFQMFDWVLNVPLNLLCDFLPETRAKERDEESPAKLLDDLFRKTKATPCIYWLPLTEDQVV